MLRHTGLQDRLSLVTMKFLAHSPRWQASQNFLGCSCMHTTTGTMSHSGKKLFLSLARPSQVVHMFLPRAPSSCFVDSSNWHDCPTKPNVRSIPQVHFSCGQVEVRCWRTPTSQSTCLHDFECACSTDLCREQGVCRQLYCARDGC